MTVKRPVPGLPIEDQPPEIVAAMLVYGEARGEKPLAAAAVLCVALNRAYGENWETGWKNDPVRLKTAVLKPAQFSCFDAHDPNRALLLTAFSTDPLSWVACQAIADLVLSGAVDDPTGGATHYIRTERWNTMGKRWFQNQEIADGRTVKRAEVGSHTFAVAPGSFV